MKRIVLIGSALFEGSFIRSQNNFFVIRSEAHAQPDSCACRELSLQDFIFQKSPNFGQAQAGKLFRDFLDIVNVAAEYLLARAKSTEKSMGSDQIEMIGFLCFEELMEILEDALAGADVFVGV